VYFSDRNPTSNDGALRVWYVTSNTVRTIVGQPSRQIGDGLITSATVGASAIWGLAIGAYDSTVHWFGWTESDKDTLRIATDSSVAQSEAMPCPIGQYFTAGVCTPCTNVIPFGTTYVRSGTPNGNDCPWACPEPPVKLPFVCPDFAEAIANGRRATPTVGSTTEELVCNVQFEKNAGGTACQACSQNYYCTGLNFNDEGKEACYANSHSPASSGAITDCKCDATFYGAYGTNCTTCPANTYCPTESISPSGCTPNSNSPPGEFLWNESSRCSGFTMRYSVSTRIHARAVSCTLWSVHMFRHAWSTTRRRRCRCSEESRIPFASAMLRINRSPWLVVPGGCL
jgi:hypothetical protein